MADRAKYIQLGVKNGITSLDSIKEVYNSYKDGGDKSNNTESLSNKIVRSTINWVTDDLPIDTVRRRLYDNLYPYGYDNAYSRFKRAVVENKPDERLLDSDYKRDVEDYRDDIFAEYLQIPKEQRHKIDRDVTKVVNSEYSPTKGNTIEGIKRLDDWTIGRITDDNKVSYVDFTYDKEGNEYPTYATLLIQEAQGQNPLNMPKFSTLSKVPMRDTQQGRTYLGMSESRDKRLKFNENKVSTVLSDYFLNHIIGRGLDTEKGDYISYYDDWDLSPYTESNGGDTSGGIGKPIPFYDRIYLNDYYGVNPEDTKVPEGDFYEGYLPEVIVTPETNRNKNKSSIID